MSPEGYISITGRIKDLIIRGGENIHPLEIENCLLAHPAVGDVSVVGVPDEKYGEVVAAFVIAREPELGKKWIGEEDVRAWVRERLSNHLGELSCLPWVWWLCADYAVPKYVFFLPPADSFPKTASGKIQKFKLKESAVKILRGE